MILKNHKFTKEQVRRLERKSRFYACDEGELEIFNLIYDAKLFDIIKTEEELAVRNYAIQKLTELGLTQEDKIRKAIHEMLIVPVMDVKHKIGDSANGND